MQCPSCGLYHPQKYQQCVSCGMRLSADASGAPVISGRIPPGAAGAEGEQGSGQGEQEERFAPVGGQQRRMSGPAGGGRQPRGEGRESKGNGEPKSRGGMPVGLGVTIAVFILLSSAGGTYFYLTRPPENQRLYLEGQKQLSNGQYAFAVKTLTQARSVNPDDPRVLLALARAYVGVDQIEKAWQCITEAQQHGGALSAEPELASSLAGYYRQRGQYQRAAELLRPLASAGIAGKKADLADLCALWGDEAFREGDLKTALACWEEVRHLQEGSRFSEADGRLASVYQKMASQAAAKGDTDSALRYYGKLNQLSPSASTYEQAAALYEKQGQYELAIDQLRKATKLETSATLDRKLAALMQKRGKELLDAGDSDAGFGFLQQAEQLDPAARAPRVTVRRVKVNVDRSSGTARLAGEVWNPGPEPLNYLTVRGDLVDRRSAQVVWSREVRIIDDFVPPLPARDSRRFELESRGVPVREDGSFEFRVFLDGTLYKAYELGNSRVTGDRSEDDLTGSTVHSSLPQPAPEPGGAVGRPRKRIIETVPRDNMPRLAPDTVESFPVPLPAPAPAPAYSAPAPGVHSPLGSGTGALSPEERTLRDLD